jgi:hypothetical protein
MACSSIQGTVPNLYEPSVLRDYSSAFISSALESIDTNHQTIFKIKLIISMHPFFKVTGAATYTCFAEHESGGEHVWRKPQDDASIAQDFQRQVSAIPGITDSVITDIVAEGIRQLQAELPQIRAKYQHFLIHQKEIVQENISTDLRESWKELSETPVPVGFDRLQFVRGAIQLEMTTVDRETATHESVRSFETAYEIDQLEETAQSTNAREIWYSRHKLAYEKS